MTTSLDTRLIPRIAAIIAAKGMTVTWKVETGGSVSKTDGAFTAGTTTSYAVKVTPPASPRNSSSVFATRLGTGELSRRGLSEFMVAAQDLVFVPQPGHVVVIDAEDWTVEAVDPVRTGDEIGAYWVLAVR